MHSDLRNLLVDAVGAAQEFLLHNQGFGQSIALTHLSGIERVSIFVLVSPDDINNQSQSLDRRMVRATKIVSSKNPDVSPRDNAGQLLPKNLGTPNYAMRRKPPALPKSRAPKPGILSRL